MAYTVSQLLEIFRDEVEDTVEEYLWSDAEFYHYLDEAQKEFARETDYFKDVSSSLTSIAVTAYEPWVDIDPRIIEIRRVKISGRTTPVQVINYNELDRVYTMSRYGEEISGNWETAQGNPKYLVTDIETDKGRLVPIPTEDATLTLSVIREPLEDIENEASELELEKSIHQRSLLMFCKAMAYMKQDSDTFDAEKADKFRRDFYAYCLRIKQRQTRKQRRLGTVRFNRDY